jgi:hypothetical protein
MLQTIWNVADIPDTGRAVLAIVDPDLDSTGRRMMGICKSASDQYQHILFVRGDAERCRGLTDQFEVCVTPTFFFLINGGVRYRLEGATAENVRDLVAALEQFCKVTQIVQR